GRQAERDPRHPAIVRLADAQFGRFVHLHAAAQRLWSGGVRLPVPEDGQTSITLGGSDDRTPASALVFRITSLPTRGALSAGTTPVKVGDTFTGPPTLSYQAAIGLDAVGADSFGYTVTDSVNQATGGAVSVTVQKAVADGTALLGSDGVLRVGGTAGA